MATVVPFLTSVAVMLDAFVVSANLIILPFFCGV